MSVLDALSLGLRPKLPVILQTEAAECALACLAMVACYYGRGTDLAALRRRHAVSLKGTTLASLIELAERLGLASRALRLELEDLAKLKRPCILHWNLNHFVVLSKAGARSILVHDPASGRRTLPLREASRSFTGVAVELWPAAGFARREERTRVTVRRLMGRVTGLVRSSSQVLLLAAAIEIFAAASPLYLQWVIDHALVAADRQLLATLAVGFGLLALLQHFAAALRAWVIMHFGATMTVQWQANALAHLLRLPLAYFEKRHLGDVVSRFRSIDLIRRTLTTSFVEAVVDGVMTVVIAVVMLIYSPGLTAISAAAIAVYASLRWLGFGPLRRATEEQIVHAAKQESHFLETVRGVRAIKLFQRLEERRAAWLVLLVDQINAGVRAEKLQILYRLLNALCFAAENILVVWLAARHVLDGALTVGMLTAFMSYKGQLSSRVGGLVDKLLELKMLDLQGERLADILLTDPEERAADARLVVSERSSGAPGVAMRGVRFKYADHEPYVLDGVDLDVAPGECVVITGPSGCGKTTLLNIVLGILAPTEGDVLIGGRSAARLGADGLRALVGSVTQGDTLFAGSIADNISFFDSRADQRRIEHCARLASVHAEIAAMPMGYNTFVGYLGSVLSGGQQQRILLARALYKRPSILVLDEATSHLDVKREILVSAAIRSLDLTRIIVAHRPQTAASADRVVTLEAGRIVREMRVAPRAGPLRATRLLGPGRRSSGDGASAEREQSEPREKSEKSKKSGKSAESAQSQEPQESERSEQCGAIEG
ncbi:MAG TPA: peptidase domain-containing ABC transporter [Gammaproteobacteria bacterium]|nr:peptidase domain-containing ABC transporter [Gammaproteobacteria bacterium]